ncbi:MAG TPA: hypothetical protein VMD91_04160 [Candidatus Sulfotelmatobacter sp.]|nr:hypothetical protein [Candidatus Sulfotelmatobacter sp.]
MTARRAPALGVLAVLLLAGCVSTHTAPPVASNASSGLDLSPDPVALTNDTPTSTFLVQNDTAGVDYTATTDSSCAGADGGIYVAGAGQPQTAVSGTPTMFVTYAVGTPPASCTLDVSDSNGETGTVGASYQTIVVVQSAARKPRTTLAVTRAPRAGTVAPQAITITQLNQIVALTVSGFAGKTTLSAGACATAAKGISVEPATLPAAGGSAAIAAFGIGAIAKSCTVTLSDTAGDSAAVAVTLAIPAINKFTVSPTTTTQFGCVSGAFPRHCQTIGTFTLSEAGATSFRMAPLAFPNTTCYDSFEGPLKMVVGSGAPTETVAGPTATVAFDGQLPATPLGCSRIPITDGGDPAQIVTVKVKAPIEPAPPPSIAATGAPNCVGTDPLAADPTAPHGMYAWAPNARDTTLLSDYVIGVDPTLCGASLVVFWTDLEPSKGSYAFNVAEAAAQPFVQHGLTVNLLFSEATETGTTNQVTPPWVLNEVPTFACTAGVTMPAYWDPTYESDWTTFIAAAIAYFSTTSTIKNNIGYMRFATAGGAEALPPPGYNDGGTCQAGWANLGYTYDVWQAHELRVLQAMAATPSTHQIMASLPSVSTSVGLAPGEAPGIYAMSNAFAAVAAANGIGLSNESLGSENVTAPGTTPGPCNPAAKMIVLHWCQAYVKYAGQVPLAMQPITATYNTSGGNVIDITNLLAYALDNNMQIFELYPEEWLEANGVTQWQPYDPTEKATYRKALDDAALILGTHPTPAPDTVPPP